MSKKNKKYKRPVGIDELKQFLDFISPDELQRSLCHLEQIGLIEIDQSTGDITIAPVEHFTTEYLKRVGKLEAVEKAIEEAKRKNK